MAISNWRVGFCTDTTISCWFRGNNTDQQVLSVADQGGAFLMDGIDNTRVVTATALDPDTTYDVIIGATVVGSAKTMPAPTSTGAVRIMGGHCFQKNRNMPFGKIVEDRQPDLFIWRGDNGYSHLENEARWLDRTGTLVTHTKCDEPANSITPTPRAEWYENWRAFESVPGVKRINGNFPNIAVMSNHDRGGGIDDGSVLSYGITMASQIIANQCHAESYAAYRVYRPEPPWEDSPGADPANNDVGAWHATATHTDTDYNPIYYSFRVGIVEVFVTDCLSGKNKNTEPDVDNYMFGAAQEAWLIDAVNNSTARWKHIVLSHSVHNVTTANTDWTNGWHVRQTQLKRIMDAFTTNGVVWDGGDWHAPSVQTGAGDYQYVATNLGPSGQGHNQSYPPFEQYMQGPISTGGGDHVYGGIMQDSFVQQSCVGQFDYTTSKATITAVNSQGEERLRGEVTVNTNKWKSIVANDVPCAFTDTVASYRHSGFEHPSGTWVDNREYAYLHGWNAGNGAVPFGGISVLPDISPGKIVRCAMLNLYAMDRPADVPQIASYQPVFRNIDMWVAEPGEAEAGAPWGANNLISDDTAKWSLQEIVVLNESAAAIAEAGWTRMDITALVNAWYTHGSYTTATWLNLVLSYRLSGGPDGLDMFYWSSPNSANSQVYSPHISILTID